MAGAYSIHYIAEADALVIEFSTPEALILDHPHEHGIGVGLDPKTGRIKLLSVLRFKAEQRANSESLRALLKRFGVSLPDDLDRKEGGTVS